MEKNCFDMEASLELTVPQRLNMVKDSLILVQPSIQQVIMYDADMKVMFVHLILSYYLLDRKITSILQPKQSNLKKLERKIISKLIKHTQKKILIH
jgi:hypothetical protein